MNKRDKILFFVGLTFRLREMENKPQISKKSDDDKYYGEKYKAEKEYSKCLAGAVGSRQWCAVFFGVTREGLTDGNKLASEQKIEGYEEAHPVDN